MLCGNRFGDRPGCRHRSRAPGCTAVDVFAEFEKNLVPFKKLVLEAIDAGRRRTHLHPLPAARGRHAAVRRCREGAAHRRRRVHRIAGRRGAAGARPRRRRRRRHARRRARPDAALPAGVHRVDVRDADALAPLLSGVDVVCHQAAMVGAGVDAADAPAYGSHNDYATTVLLAQMYRGRGARGWCWRRRWWSTARAATTARSTGRRPAAAAPRRPRRRGVRAPLPGRRRAAALAAGRRGRAAAAAQPVRGQQDRAGALRAGLVRRRRAARWSALRYHNVYGPGMPRDTPYSGVAAIFRSAIERGEAPKVFEDGGQMRDFVHVDDVAAANVAAVGAERERLHGVQRLLGPADLDPGGGPAGVRRARRPGAAWSPGSTAAATSATSSPTRPARPSVLGLPRRGRPGRRAAGVRVRARCGA